MRVVKVLSVALVLAACSNDGVELAPPKQQDRASSVASFDPTMESLKQNPLPEPWMPGCYAILKLAGNEEKSVPGHVQFTTELIDRYYPRRAFRLRDPGSPEHSNHSSWLVALDGTIRASYSNGYWGWQFELHRTAEGFAGEAKSFTDGSEEPRIVGVVFRKETCP